MRSSRSEPSDTDWLTAKPYAHRGLHGPGRLENSRAAFQAAIEAGHGIELDVQASRDGEAIVFHDYDLARLTGVTGRVSDRSLAELQRVKLNGSEETIPSLPQILELVAGRTPLLIEIKSPHGEVAALCGSVAWALHSYASHAAVMSFNPGVGGWFASKARHIVRGLVVTESGKNGAHGGLERRFALWRARPHFLAYDIRDLPSRFASGERNHGLPVLTWTVRNRREEEIASVHADQMIHELPPLR